MIQFSITAIVLGLVLSCSSTTATDNGGGTSTTCTDNSSCPGTQVCFGSATVKTCQTQSAEVCRTDAACNGIGKCLHGTCACITVDHCSKSTSDGCNTTTNNCTCGTSPACTGFSDTCTSGTCKCGANSACSNKNSDQCSSGVCKCGTANACTGTSDTCKNGTCQCGSLAACKTGSTCTSGQCSCTNDTQCPNGQTCQNSICKAQTIKSCRAGDDSICTGLGFCESDTTKATVVSATVEGPNSCQCGTHSDCTLPTTCSAAPNYQCVCGTNGAKPANADICGPTSPTDSTLTWFCGSNPACSGSSDTCTNGNCGCGTGPACLTGETCTNGKCPRHVFLTTSTYPISFSTTLTAKAQLAAADANCQTDTQAAKIPNAQWAAVLGNSATSPYAHLQNKSSGSTVDSTRPVVTLASKSVSKPIPATDSNTPSGCTTGDFSCINAWTNMPGSTEFWTGVDTSLYASSSLQSSCGNWLPSTTTPTGAVGLTPPGFPPSITPRWDAGEGCGTSQKLLCIELD